MRHWVALAGVLFAAQLCFSVLCGPALSEQNSWLEALTASGGQSFVTQARSMSAPTEGAYFGDNWGSVQLFPLTHPLSRPLKVYIDTRGRLYQPHYINYAVWSLNSWSQALNGRLSYVLTDSPHGADITLTWVQGFSDQYVAGLTTYEIGHADIQIKTIGVPEKDIQANILHEFGHALGIAGHSTNANDIMVGVRRWHRGDTSYEPGLSAADVQAIRRLYSASWARGEDLYGVLAQRAVISPTAGNVVVSSTAAVNAATNNVINLQPLDDQLSEFQPH